MDLYSKFDERKKKNFSGGGGDSTSFNKVIDKAQNLAKNIFNKQDEDSILEAGSNAINDILSGKKTRSVIKRAASKLRKRLKKPKKMRLKKKIFMGRRGKSRLRGGARQTAYKLNRYYKKALAHEGRRILHRRARRKGVSIKKIQGKKSTHLLGLRSFRRKRRRGPKKRQTRAPLFAKKRRKRPKKRKGGKKKAKKNTRRRRRRRAPKKKKFDLTNFVKRKRKSRKKVGIQNTVFDI